MAEAACGQTVRDAVAAVARRLDAAGVPTPQVDARLLVRHALGWSPAQLVVYGAEPLPDAARAPLGDLVARRAAREPLQLIVGSVGFRGLDLLVRPGVFIPRPETEVLAGEAIARCTPGAVVVEPCTGSGAVACAVAAEARPSAVFATDASAAAVALAQKNALGCEVDQMMHVRQGDLLAPLDDELRGAVDLVVSNPPYLNFAEVAAAEPEVRDWDPLESLACGAGGVEVTARLAAQAAEWLRPGGWLLVEIDPARAAATAAAVRAAGLRAVASLPDLLDRPRVLIAARPAR